MPDLDLIFFFFIQTFSQIDVFLDKKRHIHITRKKDSLQRIKKLRAVELLLINSNLNDLVSRRKWMQERSRFFWEIDCPNLTDQDFKTNFRVSRESFSKLCKLLCHLEKQDTTMRQAIPLPKRIAISLYALGSSAEYRTISNLFGVGKSTVCEIMIEFCNAVWDNLRHLYLNDFPLTRDNIKEKIEGFEQLGFPQCIGAIDGCHIAVHPPKKDSTDWYNYKGWFSTVLLAVVDYRYRFTYINVGSPGRCNDSQIYENSSLKRYLSNCDLLEEMSRPICGTMVPVCLMGDSAFRFSRNMMKPYPFDVGNENHKKDFNKALSTVRRVVENAFGHAKGRFRRVGKGIDNDLVNVNVIIKAVCVLHNFLIDCKDEINPKWTKTAEIEDRDQIQPVQVSSVFDKKSEAEEIRQAIALFVSAAGDSVSSNNSDDEPEQTAFVDPDDVEGCWLENSNDSTGSESDVSV